jgi:hypothetical protein
MCLSEKKGEDKGVGEGGESRGALIKMQVG